MSRFILLFFLLFISSASMAESPIFADIQWGTSKEEVRKQLTVKGFSPGALDKDGDFKFKGSLLGYNMQGLALFSDNKVVKIIVRIITPDNKAIDTYRSMKGILTDKYGKPEEDFNFFKKPYYEGDGYEEQAIRLGKATFASFWPGIMLEINEMLTVQVIYESDAWKAELKKRKASVNNVF